MRVLHVYSGNLFGGIESMLLVFARRRDLCPAVQPAFALCFEGRLSRELAASDAEVHRLPEVRTSRPHTILRARRSLARVIAAHRPEWAICHDLWSQAIFGSVVRRRQVPLAFWAHAPSSGRHWTARWARRTTPDLVIANSAFTSRTIPSLYPGTPLTVIHPAVDVPAPPRSDGDRRSVRRELQTTDGDVVIVQASRCEEWKGHTLLMEALGVLRDLPGWTWWIVGGAQRPAEQAFVSRLRAMADRFGIASRVRFAGERSDVRRVLAAADVCCQANLDPEPFGVAFIEALAAGLPVVTIGMGGPLEIVDDACGILVPPLDVAALSGALGALIEDEGRRLRLGAEGPARAARLCAPAGQLQRLNDALAQARDRRVVA